MVERENILHEMAVGIAESYGKKWAELTPASQRSYTNMARQNMRVISDTFTRCGWLFAMPSISTDLATEVATAMPMRVNNQIMVLSPEAIKALYEKIVFSINGRQAPAPKQEAAHAAG